MSQSHQDRPLIFADSNVFVEALFVQDSDAALVLGMVVSQRYSLATCAAVIGDVERAILHKTKVDSVDADTMLARWVVVQKRTNLIIVQDATGEEVKVTYAAYMPLMRHKNDISILAVALRCTPKYIISNNREHFNDAVSNRCGIPMVSCEEFIELVVGRRKG